MRKARPDFTKKERSPYTHSGSPSNLAAPRALPIMTRDPQHQLPKLEDNSSSDIRNPTACECSVEERQCLPPTSAWCTKITARIIATPTVYSPAPPVLHDNQHQRNEALQPRGRNVCSRKPSKFQSRNLRIHDLQNEVVFFPAPQPATFSPGSLTPNPNPKSHAAAT